MRRKYDDSFLETANDKEKIKIFENMTNKELRYFRLIQKLKTFYAKKNMEIINKEGKLISIVDFKEDSVSLMKVLIENYRNNLTSDTQLEKLSTENTEQIKYQLNKQLMASLTEMVFNNYDGRFKIPIKSFITPLEDELIKNVEKVLDIKFDKDESRLIYIEKINNFLENTEDVTRVITDEIKNPCEFKKVLIFIVVCNSVAELPKRDRKKLHEEKRKFERLKKSTIDNLNKLNLPYDEVKKAVFSSPESRGWHNYETTIKHYKSILLYALTHHCKTGKKRANEIIQILDYL